MGITRIEMIHIDKSDLIRFGEITLVNSGSEFPCLNTQWSHDQWTTVQVARSMGGYFSSAPQISLCPAMAMQIVRADGSGTT